MTDDNPDLARLLAVIDSKLEPIDDISVYELLSKLPRGDAEPNSTPLSRLALEASAFAFCPEYNWKDGGWDSYYGPMFGGKKETGEAVFFPDVKNLDAGAFDYWAQRATEAKHPVLRIRYADLCWDFQKHVVQKAPSIEMPRIVVDATIDAVTRRLVKHETNGRKKLARALSVAIAIGDEARIVSVRDAIITYEDAISRDEFLGLWGFSYDLIMENKRVPKTPEIEAKIIGDLERRLAAMVVVRDGKPANVWSAEAAAQRLSEYYRRNGKPEDVRRVLLSYGHAFEVLSETSVAMTASAWLRAVHARYHDFGLREDAEKLLLKIREYARRSRDEMVTFSDSIQISKEEMEQFLDSLMGRNLEETLYRVGSYFVPQKQQIVELIEKIEKKSPLHSLFGMTLVDSDGLPKANIGSVDDDLDGRVVRETAQQIQFRRMFLFLAINRLREQFNPSPEDLLKHLKDCPLFTDDELPILHAAFHSYLNDQHIAAAHLLVPQIEAAVRRLVDLHGVNLLKPLRGGGLIMKNLDDWLREPVAIKSLKEDMVLYLKALLTDQRGLNLRNDICHGLLPAEVFNRGLTDRFLHVILVLGTVRRQLVESPEQSKGADE